MATLVSDNEPGAGVGGGIGQVGKEMTHADGWKVWGLWDGASNKSTFIYQRLKFQFFSNFLPFKCTRSAKWPGGSVPYPPMPHELIVWPGQGRGVGLRLGVATLQKLCHELKFFSATPQQQQQEEKEEEAQTSDAKDDAIL